MFSGSNLDSDEEIAGLGVAFECAQDDVVWEDWARGGFVPLACLDERFEVFADELFVEASLGLSGLVFVGLPES